jgi:hypothetical protein
MPLIENLDVNILNIITVELSIDEGNVFSLLKQVDFTTQSQISLFSEPAPKILDYYPKVTLRSDNYTVNLLGTNLDKLITCTGILQIRN